MDVTIVIPTKNGGELLDRVLNRIFLVSNLVFKEVKKVVILLVTSSLFSEDKILR